MRIAILGATSQIAKDLILSFSEDSNHELILFARKPKSVFKWLCEVNLDKRYFTDDYKSFGVDKFFDAVINFVGAGDPVKITDMGVSILEVTQEYDEMALNYVKGHQNCKYIFLSSGAAYGSDFSEPANENTVAKFNINNLQAQDWYSIAKFNAECRHRALPYLPIVDIRVFNYFSHTSDIMARFLITDIVRAIRNGDILITSSNNIIRDFIGPDDFFRLISSILESSIENDVVDCYTKEPVDKITLLKSMKQHLGLSYKISETLEGVNATGGKTNYFSKNHKAEIYGYKPLMKSLDMVIFEAKKIINANL